MMLSQTAEYALRTVAFVAGQGDQPVRIDEMAAALGIPRNYLSKTLHALTRAGVTASVSGRGGGFALAVPPYRLTLARLIGVFHDEEEPGRCLLGDRPCTGDLPCPAHQRWSQLHLAHEHALRSTTIADLLGP